MARSFAALVVSIGVLMSPDAGIKEHQHCWHAANFSHAISYHSDETCCLCGENRCVSLGHLRINTEGHGPFHPQLEFKADGGEG